MKLMKMIYGRGHFGKQLTKEWIFTRFEAPQHHYLLKLTNSGRLFCSISTSTASNVHLLIRFYQNRAKKSFIVVQMDFAENYTFVRQREVQAAHWNNQQATLFIVHIKIANSHKNLVIISDYMHHDTAFVYCAQRLIAEFLQKHFP